jgi:hypothetical protein|tara:strand:+ start:1886 stop:2299 length:414 start_codon:yes stop_codon:yes gene_type:complete
MLANLLGGDLVKSVGGIIDSLHTSQEEKDNAKIKLKEIEAQINKTQSDINLADSKSVAGGISGMLQRSWRPLIGMSCALAIFWEYVLKQFLMFIIATFNLETAPLPELDVGTLMPLVISLLGMSGIRSFEKFKGVSK